MNFQEHQRAKRMKIIELQNSLIKSDSITTCTNCEEWDKDKQLCNKYKVLPPAEVIVTGCPEWMFTIPF